MDRLSGTQGTVQLVVVAEVMAFNKRHKYLLEVSSWTHVRIISTTVLKKFTGRRIDISAKISNQKLVVSQSMLHRLDQEFAISTFVTAAYMHLS